MAAGSFVVVRRTISQTIVPYKDVEERLLLKKSRSKSTSLGFSSTNNVARCGVLNAPNTKKTQPKGLDLERSRSEVCLRRKSSHVRETSLDVFEERCKEGFMKPVVRRREGRKINTTRPQSDFFPEFSVENNKTEKVKNKAGDTQEAEKRLGQCITTLRREMMSLRKQDQDLLKQLTLLNEHIQDLKEITKMQGSLYGPAEDQKEQSLPSTTLVTPGSPKTDITSVKRADSGRKQREKIAVTSADWEVKNIPKNEQSTCKKIKNDIKGLQETSFEYIEVPGNTAAVKTARSKATKRSHSTTIADVSRKKIASLRLQRKSLSCQFLNSGGRDECSKGKKNLCAESHETLASTDRARKARPLSQINTGELKDAHDTSTKHKSLSLSHLRPGTKNNEGSTSDSECSTSGCYGGSSTGSDVELERSYFNARSGRESNEKLDKLFELNSLNLKSFGKKHAAINTQGPFRKKIVSV